MHVTFHKLIQRHLIQHATSPRIMCSILWNLQRTVVSVPDVQQLTDFTEDALVQQRRPTSDLSLELDAVPEEKEEAAITLGTRSGGEARASTVSSNANANSNANKQPVSDSGESKTPSRRLEGVRRAPQLPQVHSTADLLSAFPIVALPGPAAGPAAGTQRTSRRRSGLPWLRSKPCPLLLTLGRGE